MKRGVVRLAIGSTGAAALVAATLTMPVAQADPAPTRADVEKAYDRVEKINEDANALREKIDATQDDIDALTSDIKRQDRAYRAQREELSASIVQQQLDSPLGPTVSLFGSDDPSQFLEGLGALQALNSSRADALDRFTATAAELENRRAQLDDRQDDLRTTQKSVVAKQKQVKAAYAKAKAAYDRMTARQQAAFDQGGEVDASKVDVKASGRAGTAIAFAMAQLGEPYDWGGTGPNRWDCSGLVQKAWAAAGVSLPRVVGPQMSAGRRISMSELKPGDLVAYSSMSHIGMYLGGGKVVHAPRQGRNVEVTTLSGFSVAARVG